MTARPSVRGDLALVEGYHSPQVSVAVRLNTNEAPEPPPAEFSQRLAEAVAGIEWHRYPDRGATALRHRIAEVEGVDPARVFAANGSNEVLQTVLLSYGGAGRRALVFEPTYALHSHIARVTGTEVVALERDADFAVDADGAAAAIAELRPDVTFLCSPNNPTGGIDPPATVAAVADAVTASGGLLVVDEAYGQFAPRRVVDAVRDDDPVVVTRTYSKTWSMAAARLGYLVGPAWLVAELEKFVLPYHLDAVTQLAGVLALDYGEEMEARVATLTRERDRIAARLGAVEVDQWPSAANFILFRPRRRAADEVWSGLVDRSVLVRNCASWPRLDGCLRVTVGTASENDRFLDALTEILEER